MRTNHDRAETNVISMVTMAEVARSRPHPHVQVFSSCGWPCDGGGRREDVYWASRRRQPSAVFTVPPPSPSPPPTSFVANSASIATRSSRSFSSSHPILASHHHPSQQADWLSCRNKATNQVFYAHKNTAAVTNMKAMTLGSWGSSSFTPTGCLEIALGIDVVGVWSTMVEYFLTTVTQKFVLTNAAQKMTYVCQVACHDPDEYYYNTTLDPTFDPSNEREASGESICFCQNLSLSPSPTLLKGCEGNVPTCPAFSEGKKVSQLTP